MALKASFSYDFNPTLTKSQMGVKFGHVTIHGVSVSEKIGLTQTS